MKKEDQLITLIKSACNADNTEKFSALRKQLTNFAQELEEGKNYDQIILKLRESLLQADLSLSIKERISGLPKGYGVIFYFISPQLRDYDEKLLDDNLHYGFIPLKNGSVIKYP